MPKLVFGCGYLGRRVANAWREAGDEVFVLTRSRHRAREFTQQGLHAIVADVTRRASLTALPDASTVLYAIGYDSSTEHSMSEVYIDGLRNVIESLSPATKCVIYVSSTGVYGQNDGSWVTEDSACVPAREGGRICLAAEILLREHPLGSRSVILRLAGIYGPGRIPRHRDLAAGKPISAPSQGQLNLIHVEDATRVVLAAAVHARPPALYCVSDGNPVERAAYYRCLAQLLGAPPPRFSWPAAGVPAAERAASSKRVSNARMLRELGVTLQYPSYREGLAAILAAENR
jgi:nucleoside-diphosphate-sugar epimerase